MCRLVCYPKIWPIIDQEVTKLQNELVKGYRQGDRILYVSLFNK